MFCSALITNLMEKSQRLYLRKLKEGRSGSSSKRLAPYAHARDLEFLKLVLEMQETQASW
ncbi:hypothetical protein AB205_0115740 [Aquarana catesbeiana]|uniref:Uncharacterized protein n=1 Tax=Aquarana catesbeiana TaxID=8400 RepID=A0A2G9RK47_AQUCT|nr:hypothetical protein AB205_0115740 [Aquarana catesbeiana]